MGADNLHWTRDAAAGNRRTAYPDGSEFRVVTWAIPASRDTAGYFPGAIAPS